MAERISEGLERLKTLTDNYHWAWDLPTQSLLEHLDPELWRLCDRDALRFISQLSDDRIAAFESDIGFLRRLQGIQDSAESYLSAPRWFQRHNNGDLRSIAYFSPEFGVTAALAQYSGGLGILAGDHLKSASDLGLPLIGVGLFYAHGYFRQGVDGNGYQQEEYPTYSPDDLRLTPACAPFSMDLGGDTITVSVWLANIGRVRLYLLDTNHPDNAPEIQNITDRLYGGDTRHRLTQELVLGMGGVIALQNVGEPTQIFHSNEGHAGFLNLQRIADFMAGGSTYEEAVAYVKSTTLFTTHTTVDAGIDRFPPDLVIEYLGGWAQRCGLTNEQLLALGHSPSDQVGSPFNMAAMSLKFSGMSNAVSKEHQHSSQELFGGLWPDRPTNEVPIGYVTNGVHPPTWVAPKIASFYDQHLGHHWVDGDPGAWKLIREIDDEQIWRLKSSQRAEMVPEIRRRLKRALVRSGWSVADIEWCNEVLDPTALTIGFARRFATYKRADLLLRERDRLMSLLGDTQNKIQFIFAGKAHPADEGGKALIQSIFDFSQHHGVQSSFVFIPDYDMSLAATIYQGSDIWLNTPIFPMEASGTSGMKAALNGAVNLSIADGWWGECFDGSNGWAIDTVRNSGDMDADARDAKEVASLYEALERSAISEFYDRNGAGIPHRWIERVKSSLTSLGPFVTSHRMVRDYVTNFYEPLSQT